MKTMSAETGLARFDTRQAALSGESSEQIDLRAVGARERGQLALDEVGTTGSRASFDDQGTAEEPTRADLEAALGCARATIDALRERVDQLEGERDRLRQKAGEGTTQ